LIVPTRIDRSLTVAGYDATPSETGCVSTAEREDGMVLLVSR
jgi:hypothetical protein